MISRRAASPPPKVPSSPHARHSSFPPPFNYQGATDGVQSSQNLIAVNCICVLKTHNQQRYFLIHNLLSVFHLMHSHSGSSMGAVGVITAGALSAQMQ